MSSADAERLRIADADYLDELGRIAERPNPAAVSGIARTQTLGTYPTAARAYYYLAACDPFGAETEGGAGTIAPNGLNFLALNVGGTVPPTGTTVVWTFIGNRYVFQYG